ncbi:MAG: integrase [Robiginitomaculum sp.]|nr:integrase [Robiginitomaculum sp.]
MAMITKLDQYLAMRKDRYYYSRRVPKLYRLLDGRRLVRCSLGTSSLEVARARRDLLAEADDHYWASLCATMGHENTDKVEAVILERYRAACARAMAKGFMYAPAVDLAANSQLDDILSRLAFMMKDTGERKQNAEAVLGGAKVPRIKLSKAFELYCSRAEVGELANKSPAQVKAWKKAKYRAITNFVKLVGDLHMHQIQRFHAQKFYDWWALRLQPKGGQQPLKANTANRDLGTLNKLFREFWIHEGQENRENPFRNLRFKHTYIAETPVFENDWVRGKIIQPNIFAGMNKQAVCLIYGLIETGCRPSEVANILPESIKLDAPVPYISIKPRVGRELKTHSSMRDIPLVGVSLLAFQNSSKGFPRYNDKSQAMSALFMKAFRVRNLFPTEAHRIYSFRHSFEKRMLEAGLDYGLRCLLMGHHNTRPQYGDGGSMEYRQKELLKIAHPVPKGFEDSLQ